MKQSDIATVVLIAGLSMVGAYLISGMVLEAPKTVKLEYVDVISADLTVPDDELFNVFAINPTQEVIIGDCKIGQRWDSEKEKCIDDKQNQPDDGKDGAEDDEEDEDTSGPDQTTPEE